MKTSRRKHSAEFKAQVALALGQSWALRERAVLESQRGHELTVAVEAVCENGVLRSEKPLGFEEPARCAAP
jgi:hypothetical protein